MQGIEPGPRKCSCKHLLYIRPCAGLWESGRCQTWSSQNSESTVGGRPEGRCFQHRVVVAGAEERVGLQGGAV